MSGAPAGFEEAFSRLFPRAYTVAARILGPGPAAEDVAADTMAKVVLRWRRLGRASHLDAWVVRVAANAAIEVVRRERRAPTPVSVPDSAAPEADRVALVAALRALPRRQRDVVVLRYLTDMPEADVAEALSMSVGSVKQLARRGLAALRSQMSEPKESLHVV